MDLQPTCLCIQFANDMSRLIRKDVRQSILTPQVADRNSKAKAHQGILDAAKALVEDLQRDRLVESLLANEPLPHGLPQRDCRSVLLLSISPNLNFLLLAIILNAMQTS